MISKRPHTRERLHFVVHPQDNASSPAKAKEVSCVGLPDVHGKFMNFKFAVLEPAPWNVLAG
jgi:hypothetical protein